MAQNRGKGRKGLFNVIRRQGYNGGVSLQFPPGWDDGSGKVKHVEHGPMKGRVYFSNRREAEDLGKRHEDVSGCSTRYDRY
jgi:hypothetical protein